MADFRLGRLKFNWRGAWAASTAYVIDDIVSFKGNTYVCVVNHTSAASEGAWATTDLNIGTPRWQLHVPGIRMMGAWTGNTFYAVNDLVSYGANQYLCVQDHTAAATEADFYASDITYWSLYTASTTYYGDWTSGTWFKLNDIVKYGNTLYVCSNAHTSGIAFDVTKFNVYLESFNFEDSWNAGTEYQPGDIVTFGGYSYIAETINSGKQPNSYVGTDWNVITTGFEAKGEYNNGTIYVPGDVVQFGGNSYVKIASGAAGVYPTDATAWTEIAAGLNWRGPWSASNTYQINDVVSKQSASWVCLTAHNINIDPVADGGTNWQAVAQGESTLTLQNPGDILYRNNAGANVNLPIGSEGQILTVDDQGLPAWERNNTCQNVYYVATDGTDDPDFGKNISKPWASLRYALTQIPAATASYLQVTGATYDAATGEMVVTSASHGLVSGDKVRVVDDALTFSCTSDNNQTNHTYPRVSDPARGKYLSVTVSDANTFAVNVGASPVGQQYAHTFVSAANNALEVASDITTIFVKSGTYYEQLPLTVPAYTSIVGDNLRATVIAPDPNTQSTDATPVENRFSTMFILSESTTLKDMIFNGMEGYEPATGVDDFDITQATIRGVFLRLNPNTAILGKSPYITQCSAFSGRPIGTATNCTGGVGAIIDKSIYGATTSNGSMLFDSFTQFHDLGVGFWCKDLGNAEIVSSFTYYCQVGYTCTGGGRIRSLVGNNSWGTYGAVSIGYDNSETPVTGNVRGQRLNFIYDENSALFLQDEEIVQGADDGVVDQSWAASAGTTLGGEADQTYTGVASTSNGSGTGAVFTVTRNSLGSLASITATSLGSGYATNEVLTLDGADIGGVTTTDNVTLTLSSVADDFSVGNANYARALILYVQTEYVIIEAITGTFTTDKPVTGDGSATVVASGALGRTAAGGATPALEGVKGKIFPLTNLPVDGSGNPIFPRPTGATQFLNVVGNTAYDDSGSYVIKEVVDPSSASNLFISTKRQYDVPGAAPTEFTISEISRSSNVATLTTSGSHGLTTGDEVTIVIANTSSDIEGFATGYLASDDKVLGIRGGVLQRTTVTVTSGTQFTYANTGNDITIASGNSLLVGSKVYLQGTSGGGTKQLHLGGSDVDLYNVSTATGQLNIGGVTGINNSDTTILFSDASLGLLDANGGAISAGATKFLMLNNELMNITAVNSSGCTVSRGAEGTSASPHADGSVIYYVQKSADATTIRADVDTAVTDIPLFSISNFDTHDLAKIGTEWFKINSVNNPTIGRATIIFAQPKSINANSGQGVEIRLRYSQVRMTGHDFLQVGTGSKAQTNWPDQPLSDPVQANETKEGLPGRVYYVSSDQDGNFRVGEFFTVEQATGTATLDASAFNLAGLASLRLGTLGAELGVAINEFSSDKTLGGDFARDSAVPTQLAVKSYVDGSVGAGILRSAPTVGVQALTSTGATATVTAFASSNVYVGDSITVSGADQGNYNGTFVVTAVDNANNSFTYTMSGTAVSPATGAITVERKQRVASDLSIEGTLNVKPTWNSGNSLDGLNVAVTDTQSGGGSALIKASVDGVNKFVVDKGGNATIGGNLTVSGTTTTINSTTLTIDDLNIVVADGQTGESGCNTAGILFGSSPLTLVYSYNSGTPTESAFDLTGAHLNLSSAKEFRIGGALALSSTTLGSSITTSSLTSVGTLSSVNVSGSTSISSVNENTTFRGGAQSGNQTYDYDTSTVHYHPGISGDITPAFSNVPATNSRVTTFAIAVAQGGTPYKMATTCGVNGLSITTKFSDGNQPTGNANQIDVWNYTIIKDASGDASNASSWTVIASKATFA